MKRQSGATFFLLALVFCLPVQGQQEKMNVLESVVKVRATVPSDARTARSLGTQREGNGVVIDAKGLVVTIGYLILEADTIEVVVGDEKPVAASFVAYDHDNGFGLLRTAHPLAVKPVQLGNSSELEQGDPVLVASHDKVQAAHVLSRGEFVGYWEYLLDDAIYAGPPHESYGGAALIGRQGKLLGIGSIYTQLRVAGFGAVPCNMFVPIDRLKPIFQDLIRLGRSAAPPKPWLGIHLEETYGRVIVVRVSEEGPAEQAGLKTGDIILNVRGEAVTGLADFYLKVWALGKAGVSVPLRILQGTDIRDTTVRSQDRRSYLRIRPVKALKRV
jgi:S1-C subfamily serine protease